MTTESTERTENGQFQKGNRGGPGNPFARQIAHLRQALLNAVSEADLLEIVEALKRKAKEGDVAAAKLLLSYSIGKPTDAPNPDRLDFDEFDILQKNHEVPLDTVPTVLDAMTVDLFLKTFRPLLPIFFDIKKQKTKDLLSGKGRTNPEDEYDDEDEDEDEDEDQDAEPNAVQEIPAWMDDLVKEYAGGHQEEAPKPRGEVLRTPRVQPSANGSIGKGTPSANGSIGKGTPSANGSIGKHSA